MADKRVKVQRRYITPTFRMSYAHLITPVPYKENGVVKGDPTYSVQMVFAPEDLTAFRFYDDKTGEFRVVDIAKELVALSKAAWPDEEVKAIFRTGKGGNWPVKNGDDMSGGNAEVYAGNRVISAKSLQDYPPTLQFVDGGQKKVLNRAMETDVARAKSMFVSGYYAFAEVTVRPSLVSGTHYMPFYLNAIRFVKEGERLGGRSLMDQYDDTHGGVSDHDPTEGLDDEIPF